MNRRRYEHVDRICRRWQRRYARMGILKRGVNPASAHGPKSDLQRRKNPKGAHAHRADLPPPPRQERAR